jgi:hypothetical protein
LNEQAKAPRSAPPTAGSATLEALSDAKCMGTNTSTGAAPGEPVAEALDVGVEDGEEEGVADIVCMVWKGATHEAGQRGGKGACRLRKRVPSGAVCVVRPCPRPERAPRTTNRRH